MQLSIHYSLVVKACVESQNFLHYNVPYEMSVTQLSSFFTQRSVASSRRRTTIRFADIKQKRYSVPLVVGGLLFVTLCLHINV